MDMKINKEVLRRERELRAWTQSHLAEVADLSMRTVQRIERTGDASMESASALASALNLELAKLIEPPAKPYKYTPIKHRRYKLWGVIGFVASLMIALIWWPTASAEQAMINLSVTTETGAGTNGELTFLNQKGELSEIEFEQQFRLLVSAVKQEQGLLLSTQIYDYIDDNYHLIASPVILIADNQPATIQVDTHSSARLALTFRSDF